MLRDWAAVPTAADISKRLANDADYVRFRSVCTSWRSAAPKRPQIPWLLLGFKDESGNRALGLCNYPNTTDLQLIFNPRPPQGTSGWERVCGSSRGWIALLDDAPGISLYQPFSEAHVRLPLLIDLPELSTNGCQVKKSAQGFAFYKRDGTRDGPINPFHFYGTFLANHVILSSDPSDENCVVMAIRYNGERLIYCRPGDATWTPLSPAFKIDFYRDIIFYKGRFFAVSDYRLFVCDVGPDATVTEILPAHPLFYPPFSQNWTRPRLIGKSYLVVSDGELLLATITDESNYFNPNVGRSCEVFRVDLDGGQLKLFKLENLGGRALFLGLQAMSISVGSSPCCRGNCVYFSEMASVLEPDSDQTRQIVRLFDRVGVYNMEDGTISFIPSLPNNTSGYHWLTPNLGY